MTRLAAAFALPLLLTACVSSSSDPQDDGFGDGKADGSSTATYFQCEGLGTNNTTWLAISAKQYAVRLTIEGAGINGGRLKASSSSSRTYGGWSSSVFFGAGDTLVIPDTLKTKGTGTIEWHQANVGPYWKAMCTQMKPTGDQCMPLVEQIYPVDSSATATVATQDAGQYTVTIPDATVGDFVYSVDMNVDGILCTQAAVTSTSCSAIVADAIGVQAAADGSSSGGPYVASRTKTSSGYSWGGGVHDEESGDFAYKVTTDSAADGCKVTSIHAP